MARLILVWRWQWGGLRVSWAKTRTEFCENLCEKNFPKFAKIGKNRKKPAKSYPTVSIAYNNLRRLGNPEILISNPAGRTR